jgi:DNA repair protein RecN (Recombination protein N)
LLQQLFIQNYALIDELDIDFSTGLTILTGETGAGKSIILGALSLMLGQRADGAALMNPEKKCIVEAHFDLNRYALQPIFEAIDVDYEPITVIRREIAVSGKSRAFINDTPVNLSDLRSVTSQLVDIHSQHQTLDLTAHRFHLTVLDSYCGLGGQLKAYSSQFRAYKHDCATLEALEKEVEKSETEIDFLTFQYEELDALQLKEGEQESLEAELKTLSNVEEVKRSLQHALVALNEGEETVLTLLKATQNEVGKAAQFISDLENQMNRLHSTYIELSDIANELELEQERQTHDPERIEFINERLDRIYALQHKHNCTSVGELIQLKDELQQRLSKGMDNALGLSALRKKIAQQEAELTATAQELTEQRKKAIPMLEKEIHTSLHQLGMKAATFVVQQTPIDTLTEQGKDQVAFLFSANKGIPPQEIAKAASGGELSRLMLSIKAAVARKLALPTIVFDEIDSGISGEVADKTGTIVKQIASGTQVLCITHLPQMASKGNEHFVVQKNNAFSPPQVTINKLSENERVNEIAKMLSGEQLTDQAIENAKVLLGA